MGEKGGILEVSLYRTKREIDSVIGNDKIVAGKYLVLKVKDTGFGIDPKVMDRIFEPFFTTKELGKGTGLGLAVVHGIVADYGGAIAVDSSPGDGTSFEVFLPIYDGSACSPEGFFESQPCRGQGHILFVDDEEDLVKINQRVLERLGYKITVSTSSLEALRIFQDQPQQFDLVITDLTMPKLSGIELARAINLIRPDLPIVLATGYSDAVTSQEAHDIGIRECLLKPILTQGISKIIKRLLE
jgi:CheY-like chemotaxis protein